MENLIIFGIIAASVIVNIVKNYKKEAEKNEKRVINKPSPTIQPTTNSKTDVDRSTIPDSKPLLSKKKQPKKESFNSSEPQRNSYPTLQTTNTHTDTTSYHTENDIEGLEEHDYSLTNEEIEENNRIGSSSNIFETEDDFRKAILYSAILERKY